MWADEQRMAVFRCRSRRLVWDLGVFFVVKIERYWCKFQLAGVFVMFFFRDFWQVVFLFKRFFWNAEAFWCLLYLGPYGFQIFSTNSWDSKASCYNESFGGSVFSSPKGCGSRICGAWPISSFSIQGVDHLGLFRLQWDCHPGVAQLVPINGWYGLMAYYNPPYNWVGSSILTMNCHFRFLRLLKKNGTVHGIHSSGRKWDLPSKSTKCR